MLISHKGHQKAGEIERFARRKEEMIEGIVEKQASTFLREEQSEPRTAQVPNAECDISFPHTDGLLHEIYAYEKRRAGEYGAGQQWEKRGFAQRRQRELTKNILKRSPRAPHDCGIIIERQHGIIKSRKELLASNEGRKFETKEAGVGKARRGT